MLQLHRHQALFPGSTSNTSLSISVYNARQDTVNSRNLPHLCNVYFNYFFPSLLLFYVFGSIIRQFGCIHRFYFGWTYRFLSWETDLLVTFSMPAVRSAAASLISKQARAWAYPPRGLVRGPTVSQRAYNGSGGYPQRVSVCSRSVSGGYP